MSADNLDPFALARGDADAELFALRAELDLLQREHGRLDAQIVELVPQVPYEELPTSSVGGWYITSDYEWHFARALASAWCDATRRILEAEKERVFAECRAIDERRKAAKEALGIAALKRQLDSVFDRLCIVRGKMMTTKAQTPAGLQVQLAELREDLALADDDEHALWLDTMAAGLQGMEREAQK